MEWVQHSAAPLEHGFPINSCVGLWGDKVLVIGGMFGPGSFSGAVSVYDPANDAWTVLDTISSAPETYAGRIVVIGRGAYFPTAEGIMRLNLDTLEATAIAETAGDWETYGGLLFGYQDRLYVIGEFFEVYNAADDSWSTLSAADGVMFTGNIALDAAAGHLYLLAPQPPYMTSNLFQRYSFETDSWEWLTADTVIRSRVTGAVYDGKLYFTGGVDPVTTGTLNTTRVYDIAYDSWSDGETLPFAPNAGVVVACDVLTINRVDHLYAAFVDLSSSAAFPISLQLEPEVWLDVSLSVELPVETSDAYLTVMLDVTGGGAGSAEVLVTLNTGRVSHVAIPVVAGVETEPPTWTPPATSAPEGNNAVIQPREPSDCEAPRTAEMCGSDEYDLTWGVGGQQAGVVRSFGAGAEPVPEADFGLEDEYDTVIEWSYGEPTITSREYRQVTVERARDYRLPELMPLDQLGELPGGGVVLSGCLQPVTSVLCVDIDPTIYCLGRDMLDDILPTRLELALAAAEAAGIELFVLHGYAGLPQWDEVVDVEYRTEGKTLQEVLDELLLSAGAAVWYAPGAVLINGGGLPEVEFQAPTVLGTGGQVALQKGAEFPDEEPKLEDYLERCRESSDEDDPCDGETFETAYSGTYSWVERAGSGRDYTEIHTTLTKSDGRIVKEEVVTHRAMWVEERDITQPGGLTGEFVIAPVEWHLREYTYLACCPQALTHSTERIWVAPSNKNPSADWADAYRVKLASAKEVTQRWNAEGWLASRIETTWEQHGWRTEWTPHGSAQGGVTQFDNYVIVPTYKATTRSERYVPVGNGLWHIHISVSEGLEMPVDDGASRFEVVGSHWGDKVTTYTQVTDQAPPQVACENDEEPCGSGDCYTDQTAAYERDHAAWEAKRSAWLVNHPEQLVTTSVTYAGRLANLHPGMLAPEGIITSVSWRGAGPRTDRPGESTTVEYRGRLAVES